MRLFGGMSSYTAVCACKHPRLDSSLGCVCACRPCSKPCMRVCMHTLSTVSFVDDALHSAAGSHTGAPPPARAFPDRLVGGPCR